MGQSLKKQTRFKSTVGIITADHGVKKTKAKCFLLYAKLNHSNRMHAHVTRDKAAFQLSFIYLQWGSYTVWAAVFYASLKSHTNQSTAIGGLLTTRQHIESAGHSAWTDLTHLVVKQMFWKFVYCEHVRFCVHMNVCVGVLWAGISGWPVTLLGHLSPVLFCIRAKGLMTMARPPHSRFLGDKPLVIRYIG